MAKKMQKEKIKCLVILGPTATGKSAFAVELAHKIAKMHQNVGQESVANFHAEIISADSRQVYKGLDIGSGKITKEEMQGVPHHLIDIKDPKDAKPYNVTDFKKDAEEAIWKIAEIAKNSSENGTGKIPVPIICGGTGFYISSFVDGLIFPETTENAHLNDSEKSLSPTALYEILCKIDLARAKEIGPHNKMRIMRAIELARSNGGKVPQVLKVPPEGLEFLKIGLNYPPEILKERIRNRLIERINAGMISEVQNLLRNGLNDERLKSFGLEYRYVLEHIQNQTSVAELIEVLTHKIWQFARRQMTWFKKDKGIVWVDMSVTGEVERVLREVEGYLGIK